MGGEFTVLNSKTPSFPLWCHSFIVASFTPFTLVYSRSLVVNQSWGENGATPTSHFAKLNNFSGNGVCPFALGRDFYHSRRSDCRWLVSRRFLHDLMIRRPLQIFREKVCPDFLSFFFDVLVALPCRNSFLLDLFLIALDDDIHHLIDHRKFIDAVGRNSAGFRSLQQNGGDDVAHHGFEGDIFGDHGEKFASMSELILFVDKFLQSLLQYIEFLRLSVVGGGGRGGRGGRGRRRGIWSRGGCGAVVGGR